MADLFYGQTKVNGAVSTDEALTLGMDFWTVTTTVNILPYSTTYNAQITAGSTTAGAVAAANITQGALNKLIEVIETRGQPVLLDTPTVSGSTYTLRFAIEHVGSWTTNAQAVETTALVNQIAIDGVNYGFSTGTQTATVGNQF